MYKKISKETFKNILNDDGKRYNMFHVISDPLDLFYFKHYKETKKLVDSIPCFYFSKTKNNRDFLDNKGQAVLSYDIIKN